MILLSNAGKRYVILQERAEGMESVEGKGALFLRKPAPSEFRWHFHIPQKLTDIYPDIVFGAMGKKPQNALAHWQKGGTSEPRQYFEQYP